MEAIEFEEQTVKIAENQPEYETLPAFIDKKEQSITCCFKLSPEEIKQINETGVIWHTQLTFLQPMQPIRMSISKPEMKQ